MPGRRTRSFTTEDAYGLLLGIIVLTFVLLSQVEPARWTRLVVLETRDGGLFDTTGTVQFRAMYIQHGQRGVHAETSRFARHDRHWTYLGPID